MVEALEVQKNTEKTGKTRGAASEAVDMVLRLDVSLWKSENLEAYASVPVPDREGGGYHVEHHPIRSPAFRRWLKDLYYRETGHVLNAQAFSDTLEVLEARASLSGETYPVFTRIGWYGGRVYVDLGTKDWKVVEIGPDGYRVIPSDTGALPIRFRRSPYQRALPEPRPSKDGLHSVLALFNLSDTKSFTAVLGWLLGVFLPNGPYPHLILRGEKGAGKSTVAKFLKMLVDPTGADLLFEPRNVEDLMVSGLYNHILVFDNLSHVPSWLSDALSRLSTGAGLSKRRLYTDDGEVVINLARPAILTGINLGVLRDDLVDRALIVDLERISDDKRFTDTELLNAFQETHPEALGHLFSAVSMALANYHTARARMSRLPRMSAWAVWVEAAAPALGFEPGDIVGAYDETQAALSTEVLDLDPVAAAISTLYEGLKEGEALEFTTSELLKELERVNPLEEGQRRPDGWPRNAVSLGKRLPRLLEAFRRAGIGIVSKRNPKTKNLVWVISKAAPQAAVNPSEAMPGAPETTAPAPKGMEKTGAPGAGAVLEVAPAPRTAAGLEDKGVPLNGAPKTSTGLEGAGGAATPLLQAPPPSSKPGGRGKGRRQEPLAKQKEGDEEQWEKLYGKDAPRPKLRRVDLSKDVETPRRLDPAALEGMRWTVIEVKKDAPGGE